MATYQFSALADGQAISFNPNTDVLNFDQTSITASWLRVTTEGGNIRITAVNWAKDVVLLNTTQEQLATSNVTFAAGSQLLFGDNSPSQSGDAAANSLVGTSGNDLLAGLGGADTLNGGAGDDVYVVTAGDVLVDSGGIDTVVTDMNWTLGAAFENLEMSGAANLTAHGNGLNNTMQGNAGNNYFNGRAGSDTILGGDGNDTIDMSTGGTGLQGNDWIVGGDGIDTVDYDGYAVSGVSASLDGIWGYGGGVRGGGTGGEGDTGLNGIERFIGGAFNDTISGAEGEFYLDGRGGADLVSGGRGNQTLLGGTGDDTLAGGMGNDSLTGGGGADVFRYGVGSWEGRDTPGAANADAITDFASGSDKLSLDNQAHQNLGAIGNFAAGDARFWSSAAGTAHDADDRVIYSTSTGQLWYDVDGNGAGAARLIATLQAGAMLAATDIVVTGNPGNGPGVNLTGTSGNDSLAGGEGDDTLSGLGGNDALNGNAGNDRVDGGDGDDSVSGNAGADTIIGGAGNDTLSGGYSESWGDREADADTMDGGLGDDLYYIDNRDDYLVDSGGVDMVYSLDTDWTLGAGFENLHINNDVSESGKTGIGNELDNRMSLGWGGGQLEGLGGNDTLSGGTRPSSLSGGDGDDLLGAGHALDYLDGGDGNDTLLGGYWSNGGAGDDWIEGASDITGGAGADSFVFGYASDWDSPRIADFASGVDVIRLDAVGMPALGASGRLASGDARFYAAAGATSGHDADDRLVLDTSTGQLYYDVDGSGAEAARAIVTLQTGSLSATDIIVDNGALTIAGTSGNDSLTGGTGNDSISGLAGNDTLHGGDGQGQDTLDGGTGADVMDGGAGTDTYYVDHSGDAVRDSGTGWEYDELITRISGTLANDSGVESITLEEGSAAVDFTGNAGFNFIYGNSADNVLDGAGGEDYLRGGAGNDTLIGGETEWDDLYGEDGDDVLIGGEYQYGGNGNDRLTTGAGAQDLIGDAGDDTLAGGAGYDEYYTGTGADVVILADAPGADFQNWDRLFDFQTGVDKVHFDARVFSGLGASGNFSAGDERFYAAAGASAAHDATDRLIYDTSTGRLWYDGDGAGGAAALRVADFNAGWSSTVPLALNATDIVVDFGAPPSGTINGTDGNDSIAGTSGDESIDARGGHDTIDPGAGNDTVFGGAGDDTVRLHATYGNDRLDGGDGFDAIVMDGDAASGIAVNYWQGTLTGGGAGGSGSATIAGIEAIAGTAFDDQLWCYDALVALRLDGMAGNDALSGGRMNDTLIGGAGNDSMYGYFGDDHYHVSTGDVIGEESGSGMDTVHSDVSWTLGAGFENLILDPGGVTANGNELGNVLTGNNGNNSSINGRAGNDTMFGMGGNDVFDMSTGGTASYGNDVIDGGSGTDSVEFGGNARAAVNINLAAGTVSGGGDGGAGSATLTSIENALGGNFNDTLTGNAGANYFRGWNGNDTLNGGAGNDRLQGDAGNDSFVFNQLGTANSDTVIGFAGGADKLLMENAVMTAIGATGNFTAGDARFWSSTAGTAHDANDRIIYDTDGGQLWYDADGSGGGAAQLIATLQGNPGISATDIGVI